MLIRIDPDSLRSASDEQARANLARIMAERGEDFAGLSRLLDRPSGYLSRYVRKGSPRRLAEREQRDLARYFRVAPQLFGAPVDEVEARPAGAIAKAIER